MRVLLLAHFYPPEIGGASARLHGLARWLAVYGHDVTVVTGFPNYPAGVITDRYRGRLIAAEESDGVHILRTWIYASPRRSSLHRLSNYFSFVLSSTVVALLVTRRFDIVVASSPPLFLGLAGWIVAVLRRTPWILDVRDMWPDVAVEAGEFSPDGWMACWGERLARFLYGRASHLTPVTEAKWHNLRRKGVPGHRMTVVPNGVDIDRVPAQPWTTMRAELGLSSKFVVLYAGLIGIAQRVEMLLASARSLRGEPHIHFLIVGDGVRRQTLINLVAAENLANVTVLPSQPRELMPVLLASADVCFVPLASSNIADAVPSKLLEAWAYARPVVLAAGGEAARLVKTCQGGIVVAPEEPGQITEAIYRLYRNEPERRLAGAAGNEFVRLHYDRQTLARTMESVLYQAANKPISTDSHADGSRSQIPETSRRTVIQRSQNSLARLRSHWTAARNAGCRRVLWRLRRVVCLRAINPILGAYLYPIASARRRSGRVQIPQKTCIKEAVLRIKELRSTSNGSDHWDLTNDELTLLNQPAISLRQSVNWRSGSVQERLWLFRLHSWDWAWPHLCTVNKERIHALWHDWTQANPIGTYPAWEPYPTSRRLTLLCATRVILDDERYDAALSQHARFLQRHLEHDLDNNHLIANYKGLAWVRLLGGEASENAIGGAALAGFWNTLERQIGGDGGHIERSPTYHVAVWLDALETAHLCCALNVAVPAKSLCTLQRMGKFTQILAGPDGSLPLLNDSVADEPLPLVRAREYAGEVLASFGLAIAGPENEADGTCAQGPASTECHILPDSGFVVYRSSAEDREAIYLVCDVGRVGLAARPGHYHAGALGIELWHGTQPLVVDPGTYEYGDGEWRNYFRSTEAHSTVMVDGQDQTVFAGPFRVAQLARTQLLQASLTDNALCMIAQHDGYRRLSGTVVHRRHLYWNGPVGVVRDYLLGGKGHEVAIRFHLAAREAVLTDDRCVTACYDSGVSLELDFSSNACGELEIIPGWHSKHWHRKHCIPVVRFTARRELPTEFTARLRVIVP